MAESPVENSVQQRVVVLEEENVALKIQLEQAHAEIKTLRTSASMASQQDPGSIDAPVPLQELTDLHLKLKTLRREQMDADAAKEAAWRSLKSVIGQVTHLATTAAPSQNQGSTGGGI
mmetsp:Transcript_12579/g.22260  ORF Transcript_12579/g.22260 Transcript_12579/m.22260 type:complete len:118 (+) Transcript_12579:37-390(+)|eukprot:CAMPEP_0119109088 /NCGR_PEP_ID=MMETSP1180-20130426/17180_1 /TAXON_ID=3052 ORGANISM="Chlamydomonas cf sp, Strain CCMP681" /NCGR_SAMPLE_ID=MMETSP1180 /ASSEMBLY_ACC=CAM_ASM_000741 /LENGTH=117 /DNA_ID=CAMNT_0007094801 /DNA_START=36 /DNA_END=389 /DNA_ORIENTATION=-